MTSDAYSGRYQVRTKIIVGERVIPGRIGRGSQIYAGAGRERFGLLVLNATAGKWRNVRRAAVAAGMTCTQNGDAEGCLLFDPEDEAQARLANKLVKTYRRRAYSPEQLESMRVRAQHARLSRPLVANAKTGLETIGTATEV